MTNDEIDARLGKLLSPGKAAREATLLRAERVGWLRTLLADYRDSHDWNDDIDPSATGEMLRAVQALYDELAAECAAKGCPVV